MLPKIMQNFRPLADAQTTRRGFLLGAVAAGSGLAIGFRPTGAASVDDPAANPLDTYVRIDADDTVTILSAHFDMGQGSYHGTATLVVEELGCDWSKVVVEGAYGNTKAYGNLAWGGFAQGTGGSTAMASSWDRYRMAGAGARMMLIAAAAKAWGVDAGEIAVEKGELSHASGKRATFGEMAADAAKMPVPEKVPLKDKTGWTEIGNASVKRYDRVGKTNGSQQFTIDVKLPGMLTAVPIHPPKFGAKVKSFDAAKAKAMKGVVDVVATPRGLAVVAEHMWAAIKARESVAVEWDEAEAETRGSPGIMSAYVDAASKAPALFARNDGDASEALASAAKVIEATYEFPFLAHAAMEPLNAVARRDEDGMIEVWGGHQMTDGYQMAAAGVAGVTPDNVRLYVMKTGGGYGRRAVPDADIIVETVATARALGWRAPVKMQWTREDDMAGGRYRPAMVHRLRAGLDDGGNIVGWDNHVVGQSILKGTPFEKFLVKDGIDPTMVEGASTLPYAIANLAVGVTTSDVRVPVLWWRSVGSTHTAYATETFFDELAVAAGKDPVDFRLSLLNDHPRHAGVLKLVAEKAGWGGKVPEGRHRGVAVHESFSTYVAQIAEVSVDGTDVTVHKVWCAVDCGVAINPDTVKAQMEGSIGFGLGAILAEELTLTGGVVDQANYDGYTPLRLEQMPDIEVHIVASTERPAGVGEPGVPPIGPAVANAVFAATGKRVRKLPFAKGLA